LGDLPGLYALSELGRFNLTRKRVKTRRNRHCRQSRKIRHLWQISQLMIAVRGKVLELMIVNIAKMQ
jgi:hypothetical protein